MKCPEWGGHEGGEGFTLEGENVLTMGSSDDRTTLNMLKALNCTL